MIARVIQTKSKLSAEYTVRDSNNQEIFTASIPFSVQPLKAHLYKGGEEVCTLSSYLVGKVKDVQPFQRTRSIRPYRVYDANGREAGQITRRKDFGFSAFEPNKFQLDLNGKTYIAYEVGIGKSGTKYPIFIGEQQVALIEKDTVVHDNLDIYDIYAVDSQAGTVAVMFALYIDIVLNRHLDDMMFTGKKVEVSFQWSLRKKAKDKYHGDEFKQRILAMEDQLK